MLTKEPALLDRAIVEVVQALTVATDMQEVAVVGGKVLAALQSGIVEVSTRRRLAVRGLHAAGHSYQQIADMLGITKTGVVSIDRG